jgi:hypothetical protein
MNDMERRKFEDSFQEAFKDAEATPSENVWTNIELDLEKADGDKMKRRLFFFKMLAAASIVFAMSFAGIGYYVFQRSDVGNLAQETTPISDQNKLKDETNASALQNDNALSSVEKLDANLSDNETRMNKSIAPTADESQQGKDELSRQNSSVSPSTNNETQNSGNKNSTGGTIAKGAAPLIAADQNLNSARTQTTSKSKGDDRPVSAAASPSATSSQIDPAAETTRKLPVLYQPAEPELKLPVSNADPGMLLLAKLAEEEKRFALEEKNQTKKRTENLWTSVGFAAGGVSANNPSVAPVPSNALYSMKSASTASTQSKASGLSYSVGVSVGTKISNRWVLQGGINYLTQNYDYTANSVVVVNNNFEAPKAASINAFSPQLLDAMASTTVAQTFPYNVNNNVRFVNVPLQAGYLVVNRKFGFQLNAGVSTDVFLQNTITPDGGGLSKTTQGSGDESPYRSLNFSGLMGTEFSYKLGDRYRLSLNPGLRYPFSSVYKSNTGVDSTPLTFDVGLRFRYIFH